MAELCSSFIKAQVMRIVKVDSCGNPITGAGSVVITKGFIKDAIAPEYLQGTEYLVRNANDELCVNDISPNSLKRIKNTIDFCVIDPDAITLITGETEIVSGAPATGVGFTLSEAQLTNHFSLELWQPAAGSAGCQGGVPLYGYWAFPNLRNPKVNSFNLENAALQFSIDCDSAQSATSWGSGPGTGTKWLPSALPQGKHMAFALTSTPPPAVPATCGAFALV